MALGHRQCVCKLYDDYRSMRLVFNMADMGHIDIVDRRVDHVH